VQSGLPSLVASIGVKASNVISFSVPATAGAAELSASSEWITARAAERRR